MLTRSSSLLLFRGVPLCRCFPDEGSYKRFSTKFKGFPTLICQKIRVGNDRLITVKEGECKDRHCLIVDDLVQSGGTLIECAAALRKAGATKVSAYVTHAIFPNESYKKFIDGPDGKKGTDTLCVTPVHRPLCSCACALVHLH
jgi:phosphoribosylpyrophosphate synthetase